MRLMGAFGQVGIKVSEKTLIASGILATPSFKYLSIPTPPNVYKSTGYERAVKYGIIEIRSSTAPNSSAIHTSEGVSMILASLSR